ncbi:MAG: tRNA (N(6)-L-threonylcarbamoyladenosine(37)-C(2))-methylthiotransferase MtaB [Bacteroidales bacterium]|nr:tRNA (N(6)-L-threonylcarbamoyladenosine(37)-C(2))-methylthiotransferase MtaB [Bacteroidales bacterium]
MPNISFITLGCKLNYAETSTYERELLAKGWEAVSWTSGKADVYLVNTCSVTEHSDKKSRNIIRKLHRINPDAAIVVTGCSAQLRRSEIEAIDGVARVFGANEKSQVVDYLTAYSLSQTFALQAQPLPSKLGPLPLHLSGGREGVYRKSSGLSARTEGLQPAGGQSLGEAIGCQASTTSEAYFGAYSTGERTRSFLKVQDGCDYKCHYCTVPYARGESRNEPISAIVAKAQAIAASGVKEIVITGVNTGDFGKSTGESFFDLLKALSKVEGIERYRISSIEPNLLTEEIIDWIALGGSKILPHFHIPLQSGTDEILEQMGRRYRTADFAAKISYIRQKLEQEGQQKVFFGIDVIAGFPGETDELFQQTYDFLANTVKPAFIHIFPYSKRPGTPAAERKDQVQDSVKTQRVERLEKLCATLHSEFEESNKGCTSKVLFEQKNKEGMAVGWSENYLRVERPYEKGIINSIVEVTL